MDIQSMGKPVEILLVEDNPGDVRLTQEALTETRMSNRLMVVGDGVEAMECLRREGRFTGEGTPDLILLDLNLPKKDGREVLEEIKEDPQLRRIPVVVLTTSNAERDILRTYELHANCFIKKPVGLEEFIHVVKSIEQFWLRVVTLPNNITRN